MSNTENNKRIAKNTLFLYFRMILVTVVSLFTTRIILKLLGIEDFGIYNVVAGIVGFLGVINGSLISATQRFLTIELGKENYIRFNQIFNTLLIIFYSFAIIALILGVIFGNWLITDLLVIPTERQNVALWLFAFSIITFLVNFINIPYMATIIAYEKLDVYAYISLIEVVLKLILVFSLYYAPYDKLLSYGFLSMCLTIIVSLSYYLYTLKNLKGTKFNFYWEISLFKELYKYTGWNLFGSVTTILNTHGQSLILNIFFGPIVNAAKGIADRINGMVVSFSNNFYMAVRPQIIKSYAVGDLDNMFNLVYKSTKYSFFLLFTITLPLILLMKNLLILWLGVEQVTTDMVIFSQLALIFSLVNVFEQPITVMIQATGNIKKYELIIGSTTLLLLPICYFIFVLGAPPYYSLIVLIIIYAIAQIIRLIIAKNQLGLSVNYYVKSIIFPIIGSAVPTIVISKTVCEYLGSNLYNLLFGGVFCIVTSTIFIWYFGLMISERKTALHYIKLKLLRKTFNEK